ncbi:uncharacterized protein SOCE26_086410 [Sorangium cellulosum]|uniref:Uncharacterized protein n=1 Tax=Sorangium cellulosum TaxID=56 RepID=A0A2L0F6R3_SORCE|nr:hypothetical protein [Sorangium cellulosum]AUX47129.1 uncharacterized protein SOCE26_086410 [Sorangium cellulosum]
MFSTDAPPSVPAEGRSSRPLSPLGASGIALTTAILVFTLGVYTVEKGLPELAGRGRETPPASGTASSPTRLPGAASTHAAVPAPEVAPPRASETEDAAQAAQSARPPHSAETAAPPQAPSAEAAAPPQAPSAEAAAPPQAPSTEAAAPPQAPSAEAAAPPQAPSAEAAAPVGVAQVLRSGHGLLQINSARDATVYVMGVAVGPSNQPIEVRCGPFFVRLGEPTRNGTRWLAEGKTVIVKCGALTEVGF